MNEHESAPGEGAPKPGAPGAAGESGMGDLRARLDELQRSVEQLGREPSEEEAAPDAPAWPPPEAQPPVPPPYVPPTPPADPPGYGFAPPAPEAPAYDPTPYEAPPAEPEWTHYTPIPPEEYSPPPPPPPPAPSPAPAATNGHGSELVDPAEISARSSTVAIVDAGPFEDLIELRHFEDDLAALRAVRDVRVRRFGHGRATIEVGMAGPFALSRELPQLHRPMEVGEGPEGEVRIELQAAFLPPDGGAPAAGGEA